MSEQLLVPYDGSTPSKQALEYAFEKFPDAEVTALYVVPVPDGYWAAFEESEDRLPRTEKAREQGEEILERADEIAAEHDAEIGTEITTGSPDHEIVDRAEDEAYDAIVIGSHGREGVSRILLGSVAENVVRRAPVPVMVVR